MGPRGTAGVKGNHSICLNPPLEQRKTAGWVRELLGPANKHGYHAGCDRIPQHQTYGLPAPRCPGLEPRGSSTTQVWYIRPQAQEWTDLRIVLDSRCGRMGPVVSTWSGSLEAGSAGGDETGGPAAQLSRSSSRRRRRCLGGIESHHRVEASARPSKQAAAPPTLSLALARSLGGPPTSSNRMQSCSACASTPLSFCYQARNRGASTAS